MREHRNSGVLLKYPDSVGFAFNTCLIVAEGDNLAKLNITISDGEKTERLTLDSLGNKCYGDVREYVQTFFDTLAFGSIDYNRKEKSKVGIKLSFEIVAVFGNYSGSATFKFDVFYIWGALKLGGKEEYNGYRTLTWFKGYPFTFGVYIDKPSTLILARDGVDNRTISLTEQGVWNIPLLLTDDANDRFTLIESSGSLPTATFDSSFDLTFSHSNASGERKEKMRINVVEACQENGYYLRWVDRHGFYCHYLFKVGEEQRKAISDNLFVRNNLLAYDDTYGYEGYTGRQQQMSREDSVALCAPLVDSATWEMLFDITTSPCVDMFVGYDVKTFLPKWVSVTLIPNSYVKSKVALQNFECHVLLPDVNIQKL